MSHNGEEELIAKLRTHLPFLKELIKCLETDTPDAIQNESPTIPESGTLEPPDDRVERYVSEMHCTHSKSAESLCKSKRFQSIVPALDTSKPPRSLSDLKLLKSYPLNSLSEDEKRQAENKRPKEDVNKGSNIDKSYKQRGLDAVKKETEENTTFASFLNKIDDHLLISKNLGTKPKKLKNKNKISEIIKSSTKDKVKTKIIDNESKIESAIVEKEVFTKLADKYNPKPRKSTEKKSEESPFTPNVYSPKRDLRPTSVAKPSYNAPFNYLPLHRINQRSNVPEIIPNHSINHQNNNQNRTLNTKNTELNKEFRQDNFGNNPRPNHSYNNAQTFNKFNSNNNYENQRYHHNFNEGQPRYPHNFNSRIPRDGPGSRLSHNMHNVPHNHCNRRNVSNNSSANSKIRGHRPIHYERNDRQYYFNIPQKSYKTWKPESEMRDHNKFEPSKPTGRYYNDRNNWREYESRNNRSRSTDQEKPQETACMSQTDKTNKPKVDKDSNMKKEKRIEIISDVKIVTDELEENKLTRSIRERTEDKAQKNMSKVDDRLDHEKAPILEEKIKSEKKTKPKKRRNELEKLHENIRETLGDDVLTSQRISKKYTTSKMTGFYAEVDDVVELGHEVPFEEEEGMEANVIEEIVKKNTFKRKNCASDLVVIKKKKRTTKRDEGQSGDEKEVEEQNEDVVTDENIEYEGQSGDEYEVEEQNEDVVTDENMEYEGQSGDENEVEEQNEDVVTNENIEYEGQSGDENEVEEQNEDVVTDENMEYEGQSGDENEVEEQNEDVVTNGNIEYEGQSGDEYEVEQQNEDVVTDENMEYEGQSGDENEVEVQNEDVVTDENILDAYVEYVSRDSENYFLDKADVKCELCDFKGKLIIQHYIDAHPRNEISVSKLPPNETKDAVRESERLNLNKLKPFNENIGLISKTFNFICRFCKHNLKDTAINFHDHLTQHTGELRFKCTFCKFKFYSKRNFDSHNQIVHNKTAKLLTDPTPINFRYVFGYVCSECNFLQLNRKAVVDHIKMNHLEDNVRPIRINMSYPVKGNEVDVNESMTLNENTEEGTIEIIDADEYAPTNNNDTAGVEDINVVDELGVEVNLLPFNPRYSQNIYCGVCGFGTKKRINLVLHLQLHHNNKDAVIPVSCPVNPVPCLGKNKLMFNKIDAVKGNEVDVNESMTLNENTEEGTIEIIDADEYAPTNNNDTAGIEDINVVDELGVEVNLLPSNPRYSQNIYCGVCGFGTKKRINLVRHLQLHHNNKDAVIPVSCPVNPVPCLGKNKLMFDKIDAVKGNEVDVNESMTLNENTEEGTIEIIDADEYAPTNNNDTAGVEDINVVDELGVEVNLLPSNPRYSQNIYCGVCGFGTKKRINLVRHLQLHHNNKDAVIPVSCPVNPVPCLGTNKLMFDKIDAAATGNEICASRKSVKAPIGRGQNRKSAEQQLQALEFIDNNRVDDESLPILFKTEPQQTDLVIYVDDDDDDDDKIDAAATGNEICASRKSVKAPIGRGQNRKSAEQQLQALEFIDNNRVDDESPPILFKAEPQQTDLVIYVDDDDDDS